MEKKFNGAGMDEEFFGSIDVAKEIFSGSNTLQKYMDVEAALAKVQAKLGLIPKEHAEEIQRKCNVNLLDEDYYWEQRRLTGHVLVGLIRSYQQICDGEAGQYIHWGATTQDITDTAMMLQLKEANEIIVEKTETLLKELRKKAIEYKDLVFMGRTNDQQAMPITLGFKLAIWIDELDRCLERIKESEERIFVGQFSGAVGTMASLGEQGLEVQSLLLEELGLGVPKIAWFASRDRLVELMSNLSILTASLGRIGNEIYNERRTEVDELSEEYKKGQVGSSTMPHKRNPFVPAQLAANGRMSRSIMADALLTMESTNERDVRVLFVETYPIKNAFFLADSSLDLAIQIISGLTVNEKNIQRNLDLLNGLVFSEALMMKLGEKVGRLKAHDVIHSIALEAIDIDQSFKELILNNEDIVSALGKEEIEYIMNPSNYVGLSEYFVDKVVNK